MQEIVVIDGEISLENTLDGEIELEAITDLDPDVVMSAGGGITPSGTIEITENGVYDVTEYASADVDVQGGITPTGTKQISITTNGVTTEDVTNYASAEITTAVPASAVDTGTKSISTNGTHDVVGYASASVAVPASAVDSGTKSITSNGTHDVIGYASASVAVPNSYSAGDEGKVVSNGALVAQTSDTVTANDTYDTTLINSLTVNVSGGGKVTKTLTNILGNSTTLVQGYLASNGTISSQSSPQKEMTTGFIDVSALQGQSIYFFSKTGGYVAPWVALFWYNSSQTALSGRQNALITANNANGWSNTNTGFCCIGNNLGTFASGVLMTVPSNATYTRVSFRTGGAGMLSAVLASEITPSDYWTREIDEIAFVNAIESDGSAT